MVGRQAHRFEFDLVRVVATTLVVMVHVCDHLFHDLADK
jgi:hypothetical protein